MILEPIEYEKGMELLLIDVNSHRRYVTVTSVRNGVAHLSVGPTKYSAKLGERRAVSKDRSWSYQVYRSETELNEANAAYRRYETARSELRSALDRSSRASTSVEAVEAMELLTALLKAL